MGDTVLVHVTAFRGRHKIQSRLENREYVVEWQHYPNVPVYVVCPIDGERHSHTLHWKYLLSISINLKKEECENSVVGVGPSNKPTPVPHVEDALLVNHSTESEPEDIPNSPSKQQKLVDPGVAGLTSPDPMDEGLQVDDDISVPLRQSLRTMRNQPPWRYWNFELWQNYIPPGAFDIWVDLCICLHIISYL